jgi:MFS family permease
LVSGLALYAGGSLAGGLAPGPVFLLVARAAQRLGGALVFPATLSLVNTTLAEGRARNRAVAVWGGAGAAGLVIGVLLGGVLTHAFGWEAAFFVNVPVAAVAALLAIPLIRARARCGSPARPGLDIGQRRPRLLGCRRNVERPFDQHAARCRPPITDHQMSARRVRSGTPRPQMSRAGQGQPKRSAIVSATSGTGGQRR